MELSWISEKFRGVLDLAEIELHGKNYRRNNRSQIAQLLTALVFLVFLNGSYVYLVFFVSNFVASWQLTKNFKAAITRSI